MAEYDANQEIRDQFKRVFDRFRKTVEAFPEGEWRTGENPYQRPAGLAGHFLSTVDYYTSGLDAAEFPWQKRLGANWEDPRDEVTGKVCHLLSWNIPRCREKMLGFAGRHISAEHQVPLGVLCPGIFDVPLNAGEDRIHVQRNVHQASGCGAYKRLVFEVKPQTIPANGIEFGAATCACRCHVHFRQNC